MKNLNLFFSGSLSILFFYFGFQFFTINGAQAPEEAYLPFYEIDDSQWYKMRANTQLTTTQLVTQYTRELGLGNTDRWEVIKSDTDEIGMSHHRYELYHNGLLVKHAQLVVHERDGFVVTFNGEWPQDLSTTSNANFSRETAVEKALEFLPADKYMWESAGAEHLHKHAHHDESATFYPEPVLTYYNASFDHEPNNYQLAYHMIVHGMEPHFRKEIVIDANTGDLIIAYDILCSTNTPATAETKYHGTQTIITDSIGVDSFILRESTRGFGIETYDLNTSNDADDAINFVDNDNYWNNINAEVDEAATDAHYAAEMTYDMFDQKLNYTGVDGDSMALISLVHFGNSVVNAFWNGSWGTFGDGNGVTFSPLTSLDVVGHEFGHGVTGNTAGLIYMDESGALNESYSDIFGAVVEFWGDIATADYFVGEDFDLVGNGFRSMSNPNAEGDPDTYFGDNWAPLGGGDNGGVHTNSGVQNYWFYLLSEGGSGTNDNNYNYNVAGVGQNTAIFIAFRNLRYYLTPSSTYADARKGAVLSATDLYGECSFAVEETKNAWRAVGVGTLTDNNDFEMLRIVSPLGETCGLSSNEFPTIEFVYKGCQTPLLANDEIPLAIELNGSDIFRDTIVLSSTLVGGDTIMHTFVNPVNGLQGIGVHTMLASVEYPLDPTEENNYASAWVDNVFDQNTDFETSKVSEPLSDCYMGSVDVAISLKFQGCDSIAAGEVLDVFYTIDGTNVVSESTTLTQTYYRGDEFNYGFSTPLDMTNEIGLRDVTAWVKYPPDFITVNDSLAASVVNPKHMKFNDIVTFEANSASEDSFYLQRSIISDGYISDLSGYQSDFGYRMTGGDVEQLYLDELLEQPDENNVWNVNSMLSAKLCFCVDATSFSTATLSFDLRQRYGFFYIANENVDVPATSNMRVLVEGDQISETFIPTTHIFDPWQHLEYDISDYAGSKFEVCFESRNYTSPETDDVGDLTMIDNVLISGTVGTTQLNTANFGLELLPNPSNGLFSVQFESDKANAYTVEVFDVHGRVLHTRSLSGQAGANTVQMDLSELSQGVYYLRLSSDEGDQVETLVRM